MRVQHGRPCNHSRLLVNSSGKGFPKFSALKEESDDSSFRLVYKDLQSQHSVRFDSLVYRTIIISVRLPSLGC